MVKVLLIMVAAGVTLFTALILAASIFNKPCECSEHGDSKVMLCGSNG